MVKATAGKSTKKKRVPVSKAAPVTKPARKRQKHPRAPKYNWEPIEQAYVYGEKDPDAADTSMPTYPTLAALAARFQVPLGSLGSWALDHEWTRKKAEARIQIEAMVHQAMLRQAASQYVPGRAAVMALTINSLSRMNELLKGENVDGARVVDSVMSGAEKALRNMNGALGIKEPPAIALQMNTAFVVQSSPGADAPPPEHAQPLIGSNLSGSIFGQILAARESQAHVSDGLIASLEEDSTLPAHLSAVPHGR